MLLNLGWLSASASCLLSPSPPFSLPSLRGYVFVFRKLLHVPCFHIPAHSTIGTDCRSYQSMTPSLKKELKYCQFSASKGKIWTKVIDVHLKYLNLWKDWIASTVQGQLAWVKNFSLFRHRFVNLLKQGRSLHIHFCHIPGMAGLTKPSAIVDLH